MNTNEVNVEGYDQFTFYIYSTFCNVLRGYQFLFGG